MIRQIIFALSLVAFAIASELSDFSLPYSPPKLETLDGYPGVLSREYVQQAVEQELRYQIAELYQQGQNNTKAAEQQPRILKYSGSGDISGLNDLLKTFEIEIPRNNFSADVLGTTATVFVEGRCGDIFIDSIGLDYETGGDSLTYHINVQDLDLKCQINVDWNLGALDVEDKLSIRVVFNNNDFMIGVTLTGAPPTSSSFEGCNAVINVASISSTGGFSSNIINELSDLILQVVRQEAQTISDILCDLLGDFTGTVDELLLTLEETLAPYLTKVAKVDPLRLEKEVQVDKKLVDLQDSTLGEVLQVFITNLRGVIGAFQINTLIELNLLDENGQYVLDLTNRRRLQEDGTEECSLLRRRRNLLTASDEDVASTFNANAVQNLRGIINEELAMPLGEQVKESLRRQLQEAEEPGIFAVNEFELQSVVLEGLNSFKDSQLLEIIGRQTLRSRLSVDGLKVVVTLLLDYDLVQSRVVDTITATLSVDGISVTASFFAGLDDEAISGLTLGNFLNTTSLPDCLLSTVVAAGVSELAVSVKSVGSPIVSGVLSPGIDQLLNTAVKAAFVTYEDLIHQAVPNFFQNNVTVILNDFLDCYIRVNAEPKSCPDITTAEALNGEGGLLGGGGGDSGSSTSGVEGDSGVTFQFKNEGGSTTQFNGVSNGDSSSTSQNSTQGSTSTTSTNTSDGTSSTATSGSSTTQSTGSTEKSGSFIGTGASSFQNAAASVAADGYVNGFIDFRDLFLPPDLARSLGGRGTQPYGNLIPMGYEMMKDKMVSLDNVTGLPTFNSEVLQPLTEGQSGVNGMFRFPETFFNYSLDTLAVELLQSVLKRIDIDASYVRLGNLNTLVSPVKFLEPTKNPHVLENILNFGPVPSRPVNMSFNLRTNLQGIGSPAVWSNKIDISATASEVDILTDFRLMVATNEFLQFPIKDILNFNCWLALIQAPNMDVNKEGTIDNALAVKSFLMNVISTTLELKCVDCMSVLLPGALKILEQTGATRTLGKRLGGLLEEVVTVDTVPAFLTDFLKLGEEAARLCPHRPTFNTTSDENRTLALDIPPLSNQAIDTIMLAGVLGAEVMAVSFSESHVRDGVETRDPLYRQSSTLAEQSDLLDWTRLNETFIPFAGDLLDFARGYLGGSRDESGVLGVNGILGDFLDEDGGIELDLHGVSFDFSGLQINVHAAKVKGLDSFMAFDTLRPIAPQTLQNDVELNKLSIQADFSVNATGAADPRPYRVSFDLEDVNATVFVFAALDERKLGSLEMGSLLKVQNIVPCFMSTAREVYITAMNMSIGNITKPTIEGFLQDSNEAISASMEAMFQSYGPEVADTISSLLDITLRGIVNDILASYTENMSACKNSLADLSGGSATLKFGGGAADLQPPQTLEDFLDFRDLLLPPTSAMDFGGSGTQPYGDLASMVYSMVKDQLSSSSEGAFLETNALLVEPFTESQSGVKGMLQFKQELFNFVSEKIPVSLLDWLEESMKLSAFDARFQNLNTLVSPISVFQPTHRAHVLENMLNFGRVPERSLNATVGLLVAIDGDLSALNMYNEFDLSASLAEVDLVTDISLTVAKDKLFRFPLKDIMEVNCWLSMIQAPPKTEGETSSSYGFEMKSFLMKLASLSVDLKCRNCTSTILPQLTSVLDETGVSETLGNRLGPLLEEISTSEVVPSMLDKLFRFGDKAARFCPHSPLFNTTEISTAKITPNMTLPKLSAASLDTVLFGAVVAGQVASVMIADGHVQDYSDPINPFPGQSDPAIPEGSQLLDWMNLNNSNISFIGDALHLIQSSFGEQTVSESGATDLGANVFFRNLLGGSIKVPLWSGLGLNASGVRFSIKSVNLEGLDSFSRFDVLQPRSEHKLENIISAKSIKVGLDLTAEALETSDPPREVSILFPIEELNITMPMTAVIDEGRLGALTMGALLNSSNIVPCLLSTTYGLRLEQMVVSVKDVAEPIVEGFLPDTEEAISNSSRAILLEFGSTIGEALPRIFDHTVRTLINGIIADQEEKECLKPSTIPASRYVDFREMFGASDMPEMPYGDLMPIVKGVIESGLLSINPETQVPMINDAVIAPMTEQQSGTRGTLARIGQFYGLDYDGLTEIGINNVSIGFFDARIENLNTIGPPLKILEPNSTSGVLLDNAATFGTELHPLRFAIRNTLALSGPLLQTQDELEIFGELHGAPFLAVLLARIGTEEFLSFPLQHAANMHCWLATIAAPALEEMAQGKTKVDPVLALLYLGIEFSSVQLSASCFNCTTPGLVRLPELLDIMEESGTKNVLGNRVLNMVAEAITSDFAQVWILKILQDSVRKCPLTQDSTGSSLVIADADMPQFSADTMETGIFAAAVFAQFTTVVLAETISIVDKELGPMFEEPEPDIPPGTRLVDFTALDTYPVGSLAKTVIQGANSFLGEESTDPETGETTLGINELLGENPLWSLDTFSQEFQDFGMELSGLNIQLKEIKVSGLDSFDKFHIFDIVGPTQLHNELSWKNLQVELFLEIDASASPAKDDKISLSIEIGASDISTSLELMLALDYELLKTLQLGSLLRFEHILPCIQATVRHLEISKMKLDVGRITKMKLKGLESTDTSEAAQSLEMLLLQKYGDVLADAAPSLFSVVLRPLINTAITSYIRDSDFKCDEFPFDSDDAGFVDFRDLFLSTTQAKRYGGSGLSPYGDLMRAVFGIMRLQLISAHPEEGIELLTPLVGSLSFPGVLLNQGMKLDVKDLQADVSLQVSDLQVNNLESLGRPLSFLDPVKDEAHQLNNSATLGIGNKPVEIGVRVYMHVKGLGMKEKCLLFAKMWLAISVYS